jgi:uncharacterized membrane protein
VGTIVIALVSLYLTHGISMRTTVALLGTVGSVVVVGVLAWIFVGLTRLTGLVDESAQILVVTAEAVDVRGLLIAGIIIGALGVLDDVTITQVAAVEELRAANPTWSPRRLYGSALRIGRDHVASTVNTLVLAYVGASLPLMLFFLEDERSLGRVSTSEVVAVEIVRTLVGSIGLVLAVPLTTALAAVALTGRNERERGAARWEDFGPGQPSD